jgi:uncharacterized protein involved in type VI secretion and phage assembly
MPNTPHLFSQLYIAIGGANAPEDLMRDLLGITVESSLHLPDVATITLHDPRLRWIDEALLEPGTKIRVTAKAAGEEQPLFDGEVVEIEPAFEPGAHQLVVRAFDRLHRLARGRHVRSFQNVSDADLVRKLAEEIGLEAQIEIAGPIHAYVLQANETNLAFLQRRAAALGCLLFVDHETLYCAPLSGGDDVATLRWGETLHEFRPRLTTAGQVNGVTARGWNPATRQAIIGRARQASGGPQVRDANNGSAIAHSAFGVDAQELVADRPIRSQALADRIAQAVSDRHAQRFIEAEGSCSGDPALVAGVAVQIEAVGDRFGGSYYVSAATHSYDARQGYRTAFTVSGQNQATLLSLLRPAPEPLVTAGVAIGIVTDNQDPEGLGRVKLKFPWLSDEHASDWARLIAPGGGDERGIMFLPEIDDEVAVAFEHGDIHCPYVLGGLWNGRDAPPLSSAQAVGSNEVQRRMIRTRSGHTITFDDSPAGGVTVADRSGSSVQFDSRNKQLVIAAQGDLSLEARGKLALKGNAITIDGQPGNVDIKGTIINLNS